MIRPVQSQSAYQPISHADCSQYWMRLQGSSKSWCLLTTSLMLWFVSTLPANTRAHRVQDRSVDLQSHEWYGTAISGTIKVRVAYLLADGLESSDSIPAVKLSTIGSRAFSVSSPQTWNQLPEEVTSATPLSTFQRHLKTFLFRKSFPDIIADWHFSGPCGILIRLLRPLQKKIMLEALIDWLIDYHEDSPMTKEEKLRWELLGFVVKVGFEPRLKEWRKDGCWEWRLGLWQGWVDKWMRRWIETGLIRLTK